MVKNWILELILVFGFGLGSEVAGQQGIKQVTVHECESHSSSGHQNQNVLNTIEILDKSLILEKAEHIMLYKFKFQKNSEPLVCSPEHIFHALHIPVKLTETDGDPKNHYTLSGGEVRQRKVSFLTTGQLRLGDGRGLSVFYKPSEYCIKKHNETHTEFQICTSHCSRLNHHNHQSSVGSNKGIQQEICIRKCCPPDSTFSFHKSKSTKSGSEDSSGTTNDEFSQPSCQPSGLKRWKPTFWSSKTFRDQKILETVDASAEPPSRIVWNKNEQCQQPLLIQPRTKILHNEYVFAPHSWRLLDNGSLLMLNETLDERSPAASNPDEILDSARQWMVLDYSYCIDGIHDFGHKDGGNELTDYAGHHKRSHQLIIVCYDALFNEDGNVISSTPDRNLKGGKSVNKTSSQHYYTNYCILIIMCLSILILNNGR